MIRFTQLRRIFKSKSVVKGCFPNTGGHFNVTVSGSNARVNIGSTDNSTNIVSDNGVFEEIRAAAIREIADQSVCAKLIAAVDEMEATQHSGGFVSAYQKFIGLAADHIGVVGPFLPALAGLLA
jgi:hypothetical protein